MLHYFHFHLHRLVRRSWRRPWIEPNRREGRRSKCSSVSGWWTKQRSVARVIVSPINRKRRGDFFKYEITACTRVPNERYLVFHLKTRENLLRWLRRWWQPYHGFPEQSRGSWNMKRCMHVLYLRFYRTAIEFGKSHAICAASTCIPNALAVARKWFTKGWPKQLRKKLERIV